MADSRPLEESRLDVFIGDWLNDGIVHPGRFGPGGKSTGETSYRREMNGKWLLYDSRLQLPAMGAYEVRGGVSYDPQSGQYRAFAFNSLGVLLTYDGHWEDESRLIFDLVHPQPQGGSRVVYMLLSDGRIQMNSESSEDGLSYTPYFETRMTRA